MLQVVLWRILRRPAVGMLWGALTLMAATSTAWAQSEEACADPTAYCVAKCRSEVAGSTCEPDVQVVMACRSILTQQCSRQPQLQATPKPAAPVTTSRPTAAPTPSTRGAISALSFPVPQDVKLFFLLREVEEPKDAAVYGYVIVGADAPPERKAAVAQGLACRLDAAATDRSGAGLGLMVTPSTAEISASPVSPTEWLDAYDFPRADRWGRQIAAALGLDASMSRRILFVAAPVPLAARLDGDGPLLGPARATGEPLDFLVADASDLSPRYLRRWTHNLVEGVRGGMLSSEQEMQEWMEFHSWIETVGRPFAELIELRASSAEASEVFECY